MKEALLIHNQHWFKLYKNLYDRTILAKLIDTLELRQIQVITGIRRSGKSTLFKLLINHLIKERNIDKKSILYLNMDDPYFSEVWTEAKKLYKVVEQAETITQTKVKYLFLDEVQNVKAWEKFVKSTYDNNLFEKIFITGSNSSLLDGAFATLLSGRYLRAEIFPPSLKEVLAFHGINNNLELLQQKHKALKTVEEILEYGSFFETLKAKKEHKREILLNYYETIILKDCIFNNEVRDIKTFRELANYIVSNTGALYSYLSLAKAVNTTEYTVREYIRILEDSFFVSEIKQFNYSLKKQIRSRKKSYVTDNGLLAQTSFRFSSNHGKLFENFIFTELKKAGYEIYFFNREEECDFIARKEGKTLAIQVAYELTPQNREREMKSLLNLKFDVNEKIIVTLNQSEGKSQGINIVNIFEFAEMI